MRFVSVHGLDALGHEPLPPKFPPQLGASIGIPVWHVNNAVVQIGSNGGLRTATFAIYCPGKERESITTMRNLDDCEWEGKRNRSSGRFSGGCVVRAGCRWM